MTVNLNSDLIPIESIKKIPEIDDLVLAISPEQRCEKSINRIMNSFSPKRCIIFAFTDLLDEQIDNSINWFFKDENAQYQEAIAGWNKNFTICKQLLEEKKIPYKIIKGNSIKMLDLIDDFIRSNKEKNKILFDISCFPKNYILAILRWVPQNQIICAYTRAIHETDSTRYSIGVKKVSCIPGFEGDIRTRSNFLFVLLGFEGFRSLSLLNYNDPDSVLGLIGDTNGEDRNHYVENALQNNRLFLDHYMITTDFIASLSHPIIIKNDIGARIDDFCNNSDANTLEEKNLFGSVLGTKLQAVGLFLYWLEHQKIQLIYPIPSKRRIGTGFTGTTYIFQIDKKIRDGPS